MRRTKNEYYLNIAHAVSERSTCLRSHAGAVIVKNDKIVSTGYSGAARDEPNCCDLGICERDRLNIPPGERYELCLHGDVIIKLLDGTKKKIKDLYENGEEIWVYSIEPKTFKIIPSLAIPLKTGVTNLMLEIKFKKSGSIICTPEHLIMMRDGTYKMAKDLSQNDRVMPIYYHYNDNGGLHEAVSNGRACRRGDRWLKLNYIPTNDLTQNLVYSYFHPEEKIDINNFVHHKNGNSLDNTPNNLKMEKRSSHSSLHDSFKNITYEQRVENGKIASEIQSKRLINDPEFIKMKSDVGHKNMSKNWSNENFKNRMLLANQEKGRLTALKTNSDPKSIEQRAKSKIIKGIYELSIRSGEIITINNYDEMRYKFVIANRNGDKGNKPVKMNTILKWFDTLEEPFLLAKRLNHQVESVTIINYNENIPIYCLSVPSAENFAVDLEDNSCIIVHNCKSVHAEANAIIQAETNISGATLYIYFERLDGRKEKHGGPCLMCSRLIKNVGIKDIIIDET